MTKLPLPWPWPGWPGFMTAPAPGLAPAFLPPAPPGLLRPGSGVIEILGEPPPFPVFF